MRILTTAAPLLLGLSIASAAAVGATEASVRATTDQYLELTFNQEYDALLDLYAPDAVFHDPTGDVFEGPVAEGPMVGAENIVAMQKSWGLAGSAFDIQETFTVGGYSVYRGTLNVRYGDSDPWIPIPFVTVLHVVDGRIADRTDFGEYIRSFGLGDVFDDNTEVTRSTAGKYLRAYLDADLDTQASLMDPDIIFQDPTSRIFGPPSGEVYQGADTLLARRRQIYGSITAFDLEVDESFVANHHAVFMGTTQYTLASGERFAQPAIFVVEVRDGKVTRQWDFVDYTAGPLS
jgi:ketosteroid isomerase-like protein